MVVRWWRRNGSKLGTSRRRGPARSARPQIETLEGRCLLSFNPPVTYPAGTSPVAVATADFNHDGRPDLAAVNSGNRTVGVYLGRPDGTLQGPTSYATGTNPLGVAAGDFNGDGVPDLVVANNLATSLTLLAGNGDGTFKAAGSPATGFGPSGVVAGDFNHDGKADLAVSVQFTSSVNILLGNGNGTFLKAVNYPTGSSPLALTSGDFDGNGTTDLAVVNFSGNSVSVLLGNADGTFQKAVNYAANGGPRGITSGDFNGDGRPDLAAANQSSGTVSVFLNNGSGAFAPGVVYAAGPGAMGITTADFDADGKLDLAVADSKASAVSVLAGGGDGSFAAAVNYLAGPSPQGVTAADFNADGAPDLAVANFSPGGVSLLLNQANNPVPALASLETDSAVEGSPDFTLTLHGSNFIHSSVVDWNGAPLATAYVSATELQALVPAADLADEGRANVTVFNPAPGGGTSNVLTFTVLDAPLTISPAVDSLTATEGAPSSQLLLATFTDAGGAESEGNYSAMIDWGDGSAVERVAVHLVSPGVYGVTAGHTYREEGAYTVTVTAQEDEGLAFGGSPAQTAETLTVADAPLTITAATGPFTATEGSDSTPLLLATFTDAGGAEPEGEYGATVDWGDGSPADSVAVQEVSPGVFGVTAGHTYAEEGSYTITVTAQEKDGLAFGGSAVQVTVVMTVNDAPLTIAPPPTAPTATEGNASALLLATFTDAGGAEPEGEYRASVDWGDGSPVEAAAVHLVSPGVFGVTAGHTYAEEGSYTVTVTAQEDDGLAFGGAPVQTQTTVVVADAPLTAQPVQVASIAGAPFHGVVASFTDGNPHGQAGEFRAVIDWGTGDTSVGSVVTNASGGFDVVGAYTFAAPAVYAVHVHVVDEGGSAVTVASTATASALGVGVQKDQTAGIGFWHNKNGQKLLTQFNGGTDARALGNWLATAFPHLYGVLAGANNSQVAAYFQSLFAEHGPKLAAQVLATALDVYATTAPLGGATAGAFGFRVTEFGLGASSVNVGRDGAAFGVADNTVLNVYQLLKAVDDRVDHGVFYGGDRRLMEMALAVFDLVTKGDGA